MSWSDQPRVLTNGDWMFVIQSFVLVFILILFLSLRSK